jgi:predicted AlkP superfamily pyrophosphatase or phosphodiesterase
MRSLIRAGIPFVLAAILLVGGLAPLPVSAESPAVEEGRPKLVVLVVFDGFREDYLQNFKSFFGPGGFRRILAEGSEFQGTIVPYAGTTTAPGHASIATGVLPNRHGIIGNKWIDRAKGAKVGATEDPSGKGFTAAAVMVPFWTDLVVDNGGKVLAIGQKGRSTVLLAGKKGTAVWFDEDRVLLASATTLPEWASDWNGAWRRFSKWDGRKWDALPLSSTAPEVEPNDFPLDIPAGFGTKFPHQMAEFDGKNPAPFWKTFELTPFSGDLLVDVIEQALKAEALGKDAKTDLLAITFGQIDQVGHVFGPDSAEMRDTVIRADQQLERLLGLLDKSVGKGSWTVVVTADHGMSPVPELLQKRGVDAGRFDENEIETRFEKYFSEALKAEGLPPARLLRSPSGEVLGLYRLDVYLDPKSFTPENAAKVRDVAVRVLRGFPEVRQAYSREELEDRNNKGPMSRGLRFSFYAERSGDVMVVWKQNWTATPKGADHGSPDGNDGLIPLLFAGPGVRKGTFRTRSYIADVGPTILSLAGIEPPAKAYSGRVLPISPKPAAKETPEPTEDSGAAPGQTGN